MKHPLIEDVSKWLSTKHITLWGGQWTVTSKDTREEAALWFCEQIAEFNKWYTCETCEQELVDELAKTLADVIGKYVPQKKQTEWSELFDKYFEYKDGSDV